MNHGVDLFGDVRVRACVCVCVCACVCVCVCASVYALCVHDVRMPACVHRNVWGQIEADNPNKIG